MIRVIIADDHQVVREGIKVALEDNSKIRIVGEAGDGLEFRKLLDRMPCDVLLLDISMPGVEGLDVIESLVRQYPKVKILIVSMYPEKIYGLRAIRLGVAGYFKKTFPMTELPEAVERVASGGRYISGTLAEELARELGKDGGDKHGFETLSNRELQVFHLLARGKRISIIAEELNLSVKTVSTYKSRICDKLGLHTSGEIIVYAHTNKLLNGNAE